MKYARVIQDSSEEKEDCNEKFLGYKYFLGMQIPSNCNDPADVVSLFIFFWV